MDKKAVPSATGGPDQKMRRIVVSMLKGGVAKSETSVHLAHGLALAGWRVLLVDTDVQSHCAEMLGVNPPRGLAQVIAAMCDPLDALFQARENLWLLAGGKDLAGIKIEIARREIAPESVLDDALDRFEGGFDYLILDTAPGWDTLLVNALYCSREVLAPVSMEPVALSGLRQFEERLAVIQKYNPHLALRWVVPTFVDGRVRKTEAIMRRLEERYGHVLGPPIKYSAKLSEATAFGRTIFEHEPKGLGAQAYQALVERVLADAPPLGASRPLVAQLLPPPQPVTIRPRPMPAPDPPALEPEPEAAPAPMAEESAPRWSLRERLRQGEGEAEPAPTGGAGARRGLREWLLKKGVDSQLVN